MFGNKRFDVDDADNIIIDGIRDAGTCLYELIFKRIPDDLYSRLSLFAGSIIEQQRMQVQIHNRVVDVDYT